MKYSITGTIVALTERVYNGEITERQAFQQIVDFQENESCSDQQVMYCFIDALQECKNGLNLQCIHICAHLMARF
jgi:hypothetical protein